MKNIFLEKNDKSFENERGKHVPDLFSFFKKALYEVKAKGLQLRRSLYEKNHPT